MTPQEQQAWPVFIEHMQSNYPGITLHIFYKIWNRMPGEIKIDRTKWQEFLKDWRLKVTNR